jgi:hypothetical protein
MDDMDKRFTKTFDPLLITRDQTGMPLGITRP